MGGRFSAKKVSVYFEAESRSGSGAGLATIWARTGEPVALTTVHESESTGTRCQVESGEVTWL